MTSVLSVTSCSKESLFCSRPHFLFSCLVTAAVLTSAGCGESSDKAAVHGNVTYRGEPISNASLMFFPTIGRPTPVVLSSDGSYRTELPPGDYAVTVNVGAEVPPGFKEGDPLPPPKFSLPEEYTLRTRSALQATVAPDQSQPIDFKLE
jgi:hypothetical protein